MTQADPQDSKTDARMAEIEDAAYALLAEKGYKATSMLEVAKRARASNQTLYKWYGDKNGLFLSMVERNARTARDGLQAALAGRTTLSDILDTLGPALLRLILADRAVSLNRAAAASAHDGSELGQAIASGGRETIASLLAQAIAREHPNADAGAAAAIYLDLLVGDTQIRRVIGVSEPPDDAAMQARSDRAKSVLWHWLDRH